MDGVPTRKIKLRGREWSHIRKRAIASKEPYCAICHGFIDLSAPAFSPLAVEVDHIVPRTRGGSYYDIDNLQLTHSKCNRKKGSKMAEDYDGLKVENPVPLSNAW
jgi:5-methylcytosine-specific restriction endonuclease McrA